MDETSDFCIRMKRKIIGSSPLSVLLQMSLAARAKYMKIVATTATTTAEKLERIQREVEFALMSVELGMVLISRFIKTVIDMTFGGGGHSKRILDCAAGIQLIAVDRDPLAHSLCMSFASEQKK